MSSGRTAMPGIGKFWGLGFFFNKVLKVRKQLCRKTEYKLNTANRFLAKYITTNTSEQ